MIELVNVTNEPPQAIAEVADNSPAPVADTASPTSRFQIGGATNTIQRAAGANADVDLPRLALIDNTPRYLQNIFITRYPISCPAYNNCLPTNIYYKCESRMYLPT